MFCNRCGSKIVGGAKVCSKCGNAVSHVAGGVNDGMFTLTINRAKQWFAVNPAVKIVVDGGTEYKIGNGATVNIPVTVGTHNIAFLCSIRNKIVNVSVSDNVTLNIRWNRVTGSLEVE